MKMLLGIATFTALLAVPAMAQYPERSIQWVFPNNAGGGIHTLALATIAAIESEVPQPINVTPMPGAGTVTGTRYVSEQPTDGYTFLFIHDSPFQTSAMGLLGFNVLDKLEPIARVAQFCLGLFTRPDAPFDNLTELQAYAKEHPGEVSAAANIGSLSHINMLRLEEVLGIDLNLVSIGGGGAASRQALVAGEIDLIDNSTEVKDLVRAGDVKGLAWYGSSRDRAYPDLATMDEQGFDTPRTSCAYGYLWGRTDLPQEAKDYWANVMETTFADEAKREEIHARSGLPADVLTGSELRTFAEEMDAERSSAFERFGLTKN